MLINNINVNYIKVNILILQNITSIVDSIYMIDMIVMQRHRN